MVIPVAMRESWMRDTEERLSKGAKLTAHEVKKLSHRACLRTGLES